MKTVEIVIELPIDDAATDQDAKALANVIEKIVLTRQPYIGVSLTPRLYGWVTEVTLK